MTLKSNGWEGYSMSALGQKQTCAVQTAMSALPPIADMCGATQNVRLVPIADIRRHRRKPQSSDGDGPARLLGLYVSLKTPRFFRATPRQAGKRRH